MAKKKGPFSYVAAIHNTKEELTLEAYSAFVVNRALGRHIDCVIPANEMNQRWSLTHEMQFVYLLNKIRAKYRKYAGWTKQKNPDDLQMLMLYYGYNRARAEEALSLYSAEELKTLKEKIEKGGNTKDDIN